jgi:hypothetical protein
MRFSAVTLIWALGFAGVCDVGRSSAATSAPLMAVGVNRVVNIRLWGSASTVVVGNPAIADVNLVNGRSLIITGHSVVKPASWFSIAAAGKFSTRPSWWARATPDRLPFNGAGMSQTIAARPAANH